MGKNSKIEWTHHTFNPWWGCVKLSPACKHCYAESWAKRVGVDAWGKKAPRRFFTDAHWKQPIRWNGDAEKDRERRRVFCASMADVFEDRRDLDPWRERLWEVVEKTPWLDWLLLTKRPECIESLSPWRKRWPSNIWLGTTAENQEWADERIPYLVSIPAAVRFLSCEPLLGALDLSAWIGKKNSLDWVIAGGESGPRARPMTPSWPGLLRDQCVASGVAFHFKQWGHWCPETLDEFPSNSQRIEVLDASGQFVKLVKVGKKLAGRDLDGRTWDQFPVPVSAIC